MRQEACLRRPGRKPFEKGFLPGPSFENFDDTANTLPFPGGVIPSLPPRFPARFPGAARPGTGPETGGSGGNDSPRAGEGFRGGGEAPSPILTRRICPGIVPLSAARPWSSSPTPWRGRRTPALAGPGRGLRDAGGPGLRRGLGLAVPGGPGGHGPGHAYDHGPGHRGPAPGDLDHPHPGRAARGRGHKGRASGHVGPHLRLGRPGAAHGAQTVSRILDQAASGRVGGPSGRGPGRR
jgi:hypothetical protein